MGWHRIDPETGKPLKGASSKLSKPPDMVLLNAVPGVDDEQGAFYLGDGPWDMASTLPEEIADIVGSTAAWSAEDVRGLFLHDRIPKGVDADQAADLREVVSAFWSDIDSCYEDDWDRGALEPEKRWICETVVGQLTESGE